jgi:hypothetical protein
MPYIYTFYPINQVVPLGQDLSHSPVEINRVRIEIFELIIVQSDCLQNKERERQAYIYVNEETVLGEAEYHIRSPIQSITPEARLPPRHGGYNPPVSCP